MSEPSMQHRCLNCAALVTVAAGQKLNVCPECGAVQAKILAARQALDEQLTQLSAAPALSVSVPERTAAQDRRTRPSGIATFAWAVSLLCACAAALYAVTALLAASSAPQQAAAAATACALVIIPYVFSRALDRITQR